MKVVGPLKMVAPDLGEALGLRPRSAPARGEFFAIEAIHCTPKASKLQRWQSLSLTPMSNPVAHFQFLPGYRKRRSC